MFISEMLKIVFEDGQYHNGQIQLEFSINENSFLGLCTMHTISIYMAC